MPSASFDDKKIQIFWGEFRGAQDAHGVDAWGGRMRWVRVDATRRGRRGYFARRAVGGEVAAWAAMGSQAISVVAKIS